MDIRNTKTSTTADRNETLVSRIEELETRQHFSATSADIGINVNDASSDAFQKAVPVMKQMGITTVRLWCGVDYSNHKFTGVLQRAIDYHNAGFDVMVVVNGDSNAVPSASAVKGWFQWAMGNSALKNAVNRWEIGNEVDQSSYFKGTLKQYVDTMLKPAYSVLHAAGEKVVSAGVSWNPDDIKEMIGYGLLDNTDFIGFHPYANGVGQQKTRIQQLESIVDGRKPLVASEWSIRGFENNKTAWAQAVEDAYKQVRDGFAFNYYFCLFVQNTPAGPGAIMHEDGSQNTLFWNAVSTFKSQAAGTDHTPAPVDNNGNGNSAQGSTGTISGVLWNDDNGDGKHTSDEGVTGSRTVYIDANGNGQLDNGEKSTWSNTSGKYSFTGLKAGTYKISRVFPKGYHISNSSLIDLAVKLNPGQIISNADIGTTNVALGSNIPSTPVTTPTTPMTGGTIAGLLWNDSNGNGKIDSNETATGIRTVFIDTNGNGQLDGGEKSTQSKADGSYSFTGLTAGTYKISRVFPKGYHMSNASAGYHSMTLALGQTINNVNLGTTNIAA